MKVEALSNNIEINNSTENYNSPLSSYYKEQESRWDDFINKYYPEAIILRWGTNHRVYKYKDRVIKVEWKEAVKSNKKLTFEYEYTILKKLEGRGSNLNPYYKCIDNEWYILEMDWIEGDYLEDMLNQGKAVSISIISLFKKLCLISIAGVVYKQLRTRHIILSKNGELVFIDFGHSNLTHPFVAIYNNISLISFEKWRIKPGKVTSIIIELLRSKNSKSRFKSVNHRDRKPLASYSRNALRPKSAMPDHLTVYPGDKIAARFLNDLESDLFNAIKNNPKTAMDTFQYQLCGYGMAGYRDWGCIWDYIRKNIDLNNKRIIDLASGIGVIAAFSRLEGSAHVLSIDNDRHLISAARSYSLAFNITDNSYQYFDWSKNNLKTGLHFKADIVTAISPRLEEIKEDEMIEFMSQYDEIIWQIKNIDMIKSKLKNIGYEYFKVIAKSELDRYIIHAKK